MQIVIDIPKEQYEYLSKIANAGEEPLGYFERVIMRGILLDDLKAEIEHIDFDFGDFYDHTSTIREMVLAVINKHTGGR